MSVRVEHDRASGLVTVTVSVSFNSGPQLKKPDLKGGVIEHHLLLQSRQLLADEASRVAELALWGNAGSELVSDVVDNDLLS